jgi:hypothetical protein
MSSQRILEEEHVEIQIKSFLDDEKGAQHADQRKSTPIHLVQNNVYPPAIGGTPTWKSNIGSEAQKHDQRSCTNCVWSMRSKRLVGTYMPIL